MNTLIPDLKLLLENHLTTVEDVFLNHQTKCNTKNIKRAVRTGDWKSTIYYLQRRRYQTNTYRNAYYGACQKGDLELMKLFDPDDKVVMGFKHLAKYRHYDLIDHLLITNSSFLCKFAILTGLIIGDDLETIKSCKYIDLRRYSNIFENVAITLVNRIYKYNRMEILEYINSKIPGVSNTPVFQRHEVLGRAKNGQQLDLQEVEFAFDGKITDYEIKVLTECGHYDIVEGVIASLEENCRARGGLQLLVYHSNHFDYKRASYITSLLKVGRRDLVEIYISRYPNKINVIMLTVAIYTDDLDLFTKHYEDGLISFHDMIVKAVDSSSCRVLKTILNLNKKEDIKLNILVRDPRVVDILKEQLTSGRKIIPGPDFSKYNRKYGFNLILDILH